MNVYEIVTEKLLEQLDIGVVPWKRPWSIEGEAINFVSRKAYRGVNRMLLGGGEYLTFKQMQEHGGTIKKGSHANLVIFYMAADKKDSVTDKQIHIPVLRYYNVFSIHDIEGIESKLATVARTEHEKIDEAEKMIDGYVVRENITIKNSDPNRAFYSPTHDDINMPELSQFDLTEEYYSTVFHELAHSTGHSTRLNRLTSTSFGGKDYSKEELVAEVAAALLCGFAGLDTSRTIENSAAYIKHWSDVLKQDSRIAVTASSAAEKAVALIRCETEVE